MARPRLSPPDSDEFPGALPPLDGTANDVTALMGDIDAQISAVTSEFDADENDVTLKIKFHRVHAQKGKRAWLFDILPSELPVMDRLRDNYGDGTYEASVFKNGTLYRKFQFDIERPKFPVNEQRQNGNSEISTVLAAIAQQNERQFQQLKELMMTKQVAPVTASFDPFAMMTSMMAAMAQMKNLVATPQQGGMADQMTLFLKGVEVAKELGGGGGEKGLMDILSDLIKSPIVENAIASYASPVPTTPALPRPANPNQPQVTAQPTEGQKVNPQNIVVKQYINMLVDKAARQSDTDLYADFILDNVPENIIREHLAKETIIEDLSLIDPRVAQHAEWFKSLRDSIMVALTDDENDASIKEDATVHPKPGNPDDAPQGPGGGA